MKMYSSVIVSDANIEAPLLFEVHFMHQPFCSGNAQKIYFLFIYISYVYLYIFYIYMVTTALADEYFTLTEVKVKVYF